MARILMSGKKAPDDINFVTKTGRKILLAYERQEYRAYDVTSREKKPMFLGSINPEELIKYIKERW